MKVGNPLLSCDNLKQPIHFTADIRQLACSKRKWSSKIAGGNLDRC
jgi:hypothetical protein